MLLSSENCPDGISVLEHSDIVKIAEHWREIISNIKTIYANKSGVPIYVNLIANWSDPICVNLIANWSDPINVNLIANWSDSINVNLIANWSDPC